MKLALMRFCHQVTKLQPNLPSRSFHLVVLREHFGESLSSFQTLMKFPVTPANLLLKQPGEFGKLFLL